jgi:hypothetical protein
VEAHKFEDEEDVKRNTKKPAGNAAKTRKPRVTAPVEHARFDAFTQIVMNNGKDMGMRLRAAINLLRDRDPRVIPFLEKLQRAGDDSQQLRATSALSRYKARAQKTMDNSPQSDVAKMNATILDSYVMGTPEQRTKARGWLYRKPDAAWFTPAQVHALISTISSDRDAVAQVWYLRALNGLEAPELRKLIETKDQNDNTTHSEHVDDRS